MLIKCTCPVCGDVKEIFTPTKNHIDWQNGLLIQKAMPFLSSDDQERMVSGICTTCWGELFPEDN